VSQLRQMVGNTEDMVKSSFIPCPILDFNFMLELNPSHQSTMSAKLFLITGELFLKHPIKMGCH